MLSLVNEMSVKVFIKCHLEKHNLFRYFFIFVIKKPQTGNASIPYNQANRRRIDPHATIKQAGNAYTPLPPPPSPYN